MLLKGIYRLNGSDLECKIHIKAILGSGENSTAQIDIVELKDEKFVSTRLMQLDAKSENDFESAYEQIKLSEDFDEVVKL